MSKYDISWRKQLEFRLATRKARTDTLKTAAIVLFIVLAYGVVGTLDYHAERAYYAEKAAEAYAAKAEALENCERGALGYHYPDGKAYQCGVKL